jgi:hypothetical protein
MFDLSNYPLAVSFFIGLASILAVSEIGWQLGLRTKGQASNNFSTLESAMLGLLALMLAFTFSMALSRFEARRDAVLNEANAIGTTALRARLLPEPQRSEERAIRVRAPAVERANDPDRARIVKIKDPNGKAGTFTFDKGWSSVAEIEAFSEDAVRDADEMGSVPIASRAM